MNQRPSTQNAKLATLEGLSSIVLVGTILLGILFLVCLFTYDPRSPRGLSETNAEVILAAFMPVVGVTILGYRNFLFGAVRVGNVHARAPVRIHAGAVIVYSSTVFGLIAAAATILCVSEAHLTDAAGRKLAGAGAFAWSATIGFIFHQFLKSYLAAGGDQGGTGAQKDAGFDQPRFE